MSSVIAQSARRLLVLCATAGFLLVGCSSDDSPTRPQQQPSAPGSSTNATFAVTVTVSSSELTVGSDEQTLVSVSVRRTDNNQLPPDGAVIQIVTTLGTFVDGTQAVNAVLNRGVTQVSLLPGDVPGVATVQASIQDSFAQIQIPIVGSSTFFAGSVSPGTGIPGGGETVSINGQGFVSPVKVEFLVQAAVGGGSETLFVNNASVQSISPETIVVTTPPAPVSVNVNETLTVDVRVTNKVGTTDETIQTLEGAFLYSLGGSILQPAITSLSPANGPNEGGTRIRILGDGFEQPIQVLFGTGSVAAFTGLEAVVESSSRNELTVVSPAAQGIGLDLRNSTVSILVRNKNSGFATVVPSAFRYGFLGGVTISSFAPGQAEYNVPGTLVTIFGAGFDEPVAVSLAGFAMPILSVTGSEVVVRTEVVVPTTCADITGPVSLTNIETGDNGNSGGTLFVFRVFEPFVAGITPNTAPFSGGTAATINGTQFESPSRVVFSNGGEEVSAQIQSVSDTEISVIVPPLPGDPETEPCDDNGDGTEGTRPIATPVSVTVESLATTCTDTFQNGFIYEPVDTTCNESEIPLAAAFSSEQLNGNTIQFVNESTGNPPLTFEWDFTNNGSIDSTATNPQFTYPTDGTYAVRLVVTDVDGNTDTVINTVTIDPPAPPPVDPPPTAGFEFFIVGGSTVQFTNTSSADVITYAWDFTNDGTIDSASENPQFVFPGPGTYATRLRVLGPGGSDEIVKSVTIP